MCIRDRFKVYKEACSLYEKEIVETPPDARLRGFEARLMNIKLVQCVQKYFPLDVYKRQMY